jgi:hypothetical protein
MTDGKSMLNDPETLKGLAKQLRTEAERAEAMAEKIEKEGLATPEPHVPPGCWVIIHQCFAIQKA